MIWLLVVGSNDEGSRWASTHPTAIAVAMPPSEMMSELTMERESPMLMLKARPMMGSINGATIMAPITVATESPMSP